VIKTALKLAFVALLANATWQFASVYWSHYKFVDAVHSTTQFRGNKSDAQLRDRILELATQFDVPVSDENLTVRVVDDHTLVDTAYTRRIELAPRITYPWSFTIHTDSVRPALELIDTPK
jgi:hypothetical protein